MLPAFAIEDDRVLGLLALIYGWAGIDKPSGWSWLANPLFVFTLLLFFHRKGIWRRIALCTALAAFLFSFSFLLVDEIPGKKTAAMVGIVTLRAGYWTWLCSMGALLIAAILNNSEETDKLHP